MGEVFRATDHRLGRAVALKRVRSDRHARGRPWNRLRREAWAIAHLDHPAIVRIHDILEEGDDLWLVMELIPGGTLAERLVDGPVPLVTAITWAHQVTGGLAAIHAAGLLHRDLKPQNLMLHPDGSIRIFDFGLAKPYGPPTPTARSQHLAGTVTTTGQWAGTPWAMAPEQVLGGAIGPRSDLFALGVLIHTMIRGVSPFVGDDVQDTVRRLLSHDPPPLCSFEPDCPPDLDRLVSRLLAKSPELRPASTEVVVDALATLERRLRAGASESVLPVGPGAPERLRRRPPKRRCPTELLQQRRAHSGVGAPPTVPGPSRAEVRRAPTSSDTGEATWASNSSARVPDLAIEPGTSFAPLRPDTVRSSSGPALLAAPGAAGTGNDGTQGDPMASFQILREVNLQLRDILWQSIQDEQILRNAIPTPQSITFLDPTQASQDPSKRLSLWLYHLDLDGIVRNQTPPPVVRSGDAGKASVPGVPIPLLLHYLVTPLIEPGEGDLVVLGRVLQVFHANGIFDTHDQGGGGQSLRLTFEPLAIDQVSLLWQALASPMRLSVGYQVRIVRIDGESQSGAAVRDRSDRLG